MLAPHRRVTIIEAEEAPGVHATGRSAAFWHETYGGAVVQPLSTASFEPLAHPDAAFSERPFLSPRVALTIGRRAESAAVEAYARDFAARGVEVERLSGDALPARIPGLRPGGPVGARAPRRRATDLPALPPPHLPAA